MIAARPAERRQMLEEAAGIAGLHVRRKDAEAELRATEANLQRLDELLADQEQRVAALKRQARAAERYRALTDRIRLAEGAPGLQPLAEADCRRHRRQARRPTRRWPRSPRCTGALEQAQGAPGRRRRAGRRASRGGIARPRGRPGPAHKLATCRAALDTAGRRLVELGKLEAQLGDERGAKRRCADDAATATARLDRRKSKRSPPGSPKAGTRDGAGRRARPGRGEGGRGTALAVSSPAKPRCVPSGEVGRRLWPSQLSASSGARLRRARARRVGAAMRRSRGEMRAGREAAAAAATVPSRPSPRPRRSEPSRRSARKGRPGLRRARTAARAPRASEARALRKRAGVGAGPRLLAALTVAPGYEKALAAALGDDLGAPLGARRRPRAGRAPRSTPATRPLPAGLSPRSPTTSRRPPNSPAACAQVGVVDEDDGQPLPPASGSSPSPAACADGTGSSPAAAARRRPSG